MKPKGLTSLAFKNAVSAVFSRASGILVGIILTPFILSRLGQDLYGVLTATGSTFEYLVLLRGGLGSAMRRHVTIRIHTGMREEARQHYQAGFWWGLLLRAPILVAGLILAAPLCRFVHLPPDLLKDGALGVSFIIVAAVATDISVIFEVPTYATGNTAGLSLIRAGGALLRLAFIPAGFLLFRPTLGLYGGIITLLAVLVLLGIAALAEHNKVVGRVVPRPGLGTPAIRRELLSYGGVALLGQGAALLYVTTDNLLIGRIYGAALVTYYSLGARWLPMISSFVSSAVNPLTPLFTQLEAQDEDERTRSAVLRTVAVTSALAIPSCLVLCVLGDLFLIHWVGEQYRGAWPILLASLAPASLDIALSPVWTALVGRGRIGWVSTGDMIVAVCNVALSLTLALGFHLGLMGFALGNTAALLAKNLLLRPLVGRRERSLPSMRSLFATYLRALAGGVPALLLLGLARPLYGGSLTGVLFAGAAGGVVCLIGSAWAAMGRHEARKVWRAVRSTRP